METQMETQMETPVNTMHSENQVVLPTIPTSMSEGLSERHTAFREGGQSLNDDSKKSESEMENAVKRLVETTTLSIENINKKYGTNFECVYKKKITFYELQCIFKNALPDEAPEPDENNKNCFFTPDGGFIFMRTENTEHLLLVLESKVQGTNDTRLAKELPRQALGNAIERAFKNINSAKLLCLLRKVFPYVICASGCDFHSSETIGQRLEIANYGVKNHYMEVTAENKDENVHPHLTTLCTQVNIKKRFGSEAVASIFVKAHKWNMLPHGSSDWSEEEIYLIGCTVITQSMRDIPLTISFD